MRRPDGSRTAVTAVDDGYRLGGSPGLRLRWYLRVRSLRLRLRLATLRATLRAIVRGLLQAMRDVSGTALPRVARGATGA